METAEIHLVNEEQIWGVGYYNGCLIVSALGVMIVTSEYQVLYHTSILMQKC